jgi:hypothetical protein
VSVKKISVTRPFLNGPYGAVPGEALDIKVNLDGFDFNITPQINQLSSTELIAAAILAKRFEEIGQQISTMQTTLNKALEMQNATRAANEKQRQAYNELFVLIRDKFEKIPSEITSSPEFKNALSTLKADMQAEISRRSIN